MMGYLGQTITIPWEESFYEYYEPENHKVGKRKIHF